MRLKLNKKSGTVRSSKTGLGRVRPAYYSGGRKTTAPPPPATRVRRPMRHYLNYLWLALAVIALIFCLRVKNQANLTVDSQAYHSQADYRAAVTLAFGGLWNSNKLTLDRSGISNKLKKQFPEINTASVSIGLISQIPSVTLTIAAPSFNFISGKKIYVVSANGFIATESKRLPQSGELPTLTDQSGFEATPGKQVLGTKSIDFINTLIAQCRRGKTQISSLTLPAKPQELDLRAQGASYYVKFDLNGDPDLQAGQYLAAKHKFESEGSGPQEYLDVRVAGKVYYK